MRHNIKCLYCDGIIDEYARVLLERRHPPERARRLIAYLQGAFASVEIVSTEAPTPPSDPDDEIFVICALDGDADYLVSGDKHLLALRPHYERPIVAQCANVLAALGEP